MADNEFLADCEDEPVEVGVPSSTTAGAFALLIDLQFCRTVASQTNDPRQRARCYIDRAPVDVVTCADGEVLVVRVVVVGTNAGFAFERI